MRPQVILKLATTLDGKIALKNRQSQWITNEKSRAYVQKIRAEADAIACGIGTVLSDNPKLNLRGDYSKPVSEMPKRIVFDSKLRTPADFNIVDDKIGGETIIFHNVDLKTNDTTTIYPNNVKLYNINANDDGLNINDALDILGDLGVKTVMVETGGKLASSFILNGLIDKIYWFFAPKIIGGDGVDVFGDFNLLSMSEIIKLNQIDMQIFDDDILRIFEVE